MLNIYPDLVSNFHSCVADKNNPYIWLTERHIQAIWLEQKYFKNLCSSDGELIQVLSPGIWNAEAGPDFLKAHLRIGDKDIKGDIEIHLHEESWYHHRHHNDERYDQVVLHLCFWDPKNKKESITQSGKKIVTAYLENQMTIPIARIVHLIDLDLYPYRKFIGAGRCAQHLFKSLAPKKIISLFASAAYWRLEQKQNFLQLRFLPMHLQMAAGIAMALGYKHNTKEFLGLFEFLLSYRDLPSNEFLAIALGCSGFFNDPKTHWKDSSFFCELKTAWEAKRDEIEHQTVLRLDHIRPFNHPVRRIAYLVKLLQDSQLELLWEQLKGFWNGSIFKLNNKPKEALKVFQGMIEIIPNYDDSYWNYHYTFEVVPKVNKLSLVGNDLKREMVINTFLPLLYKHIKEEGNSETLEAFEILYSSIRSSENSKDKYLTHRFFGTGEKGDLLGSAQMKQGAYQLHKDYCIHFEASCEGCPFVERYTKAHLS